MCCARSSGKRRKCWRLATRWDRDAKNCDRSAEREVSECSAQLATYQALRLICARLSRETATWSMSVGRIPAMRRHSWMESAGNPPQCLRRFRRSSSIAQHRSPSMKRAALASAWYAFRPRTILLIAWSMVHGRLPLGVNIGRARGDFQGSAINDGERGEGRAVGKGGRRRGYGSMNALSSRTWVAWRSLRRAWTSSWRMRSRDRPKLWPISSSVRSDSCSMP